MRHYLSIDTFHFDLLTRCAFDLFTDQCPGGMADFYLVRFDDLLFEVGVEFLVFCKFLGLSITHYR